MFVRRPSYRRRLPAQDGVFALRGGMCRHLTGALHAAYMLMSGMSGGVVHPEAPARAPFLCCLLRPSSAFACEGAMELLCLLLDATAAFRRVPCLLL